MSEKWGSGITGESGEIRQRMNMEKLKLTQFPKELEHSMKMRKVKH
jgi:hypothetical protein